MNHRFFRGLGHRRRRVVVRSAEPACGQQYQNAGIQKNARPDHRPVFRYPWHANGPAPISQQHILEREIATDFAPLCLTIPACSQSG